MLTSEELTKRLMKPELPAFVRLDQYLNVKRNSYCETVFFDEEMFRYAMEFYNEYFGYKENPITMEEAMAYAQLGKRLNADYYKVLMPMDQDKLNFFYETTPFYFFHDVLRFMDGHHLEDLFRLLDTGKTKFLDFAGGTGGASIFLAQHNKDVTFYDTNKIQYTWVKWISNKLNLNIKVVTDINELQGPFEEIIASDIVEHVINPGELITFLGKLATPGGAVGLSYPPCPGPDEFAPMHFKVAMDKNKNIIFSEEENIATLTRNTLP